MPQRALHDPAFREAAGGTEWALERASSVMGEGREGLGLSSGWCPSSCDYSAVPHPCLRLQHHAPPTIPSIICPHLSPPVCARPVHLSPAPSTFSPSWLEASTGEGSVLPTLLSRCTGRHPPLLLSFTVHLISSMPAQTSPHSSSSSKPSNLPRPCPFPSPILPACLSRAATTSSQPSPVRPTFHLRPAPAHRLKCQAPWPYSACVPFLPIALWT